jgi:hypothetical protein
MPELDPFEEEQLRSLFYKKHGFGLDHSTIQNNKWTLAVWNEDSVPHFRDSNHLISDLDSIWKELANTDRNTTVLPEQAEILTDKKNYLLDYSKNVDNILTNAGMGDMAKNRTAESSNGTSHVAVGTGTTTESVSDTALETEVDRKAWAEKVTVNQTERYASSFSRSDFSSDVTLTEAGGFTDDNTGDNILVFRVTYSDKSISTGQIMTTQVAITHVNGTVV